MKVKKEVEILKRRESVRKGGPMLHVWDIYVHSYMCAHIEDRVSFNSFSILIGEVIISNHNEDILTNDSIIELQY